MFINFLINIFSKNLTENEKELYVFNAIRKGSTIEHIVYISGFSQRFIHYVM